MRKVLDLWTKNATFPVQFMARLRDLVNEGDSSAQGTFFEQIILMTACSQVYFLRYHVHLSKSKNRKTTIYACARNWLCSYMVTPYMHARSILFISCLSYSILRLRTGAMNQKLRIRSYRSSGVHVVLTTNSDGIESLHLVSQERTSVDPRRSSITAYPQQQGASNSPPAGMTPPTTSGSTPNGLPPALLALLGSTAPAAAIPPPAPLSTPVSHRERPEMRKLILLCDVFAGRYRI